MFHTVYDFRLHWAPVTVSDSIPIWKALSITEFDAVHGGCAKFLEGLFIHT